MVTGGPGNATVEAVVSRAHHCIGFTYGRVACEE